MTKKKVKKEKRKIGVCDACKKESITEPIICSNCDNNAQGACDNCSDPYCYDCFDDHLRDYIGLTPLEEETTTKCVECDEITDDCYCEPNEEENDD